MPAPPAISPADFSVLCDVIHAVARAGGLPHDEAQDFAQTVHLKMLERSYAPLVRFDGRSSLRTFLTVVVRRLLLDWRNQHLGKWRPSARAQRLGPAAVEVDRLISRDGHLAAEAIAIVAPRADAPSVAALQALADQLPARPRRRFVGADDLERLPGGTFEDPVEAAQEAAVRRARLQLLRRAYRRLAAADRRILYLRFERNLTVAAIAAELGVPAKLLYRRIGRLLRSLRRDVTDVVPQRTRLH